MEEAINQPETFEIGLVRINTNDDSDDTIPWSPRVETINLTESGAASGQDSDETILWNPRVKTLARVESGITSVSKFHSLDEMSQDESEGENAPPFNLKESYVAMRIALKVVRKRRRKKVKLKRDKWHVNSEDTEWSPIQAKKPSTKIVLVKNRVQSSSPENSEDEQSQSESQSRLWKQNNHRWFPPTDRRHKQNQTPQKKQERVNDKQIRKLLLTDEKSQASLLQFYKSNWERQKLMKKESEVKSELGLLKKTALGGENRPQYISVVSHCDTELGRVLNDEVVTELALSAFPAGHQLGSRPECGDSRSRSLEGLRLGSVRHSSNIPETNEYSASSDIERPKQDDQGKEDSNMEGSSPSRKVLIEASVPSFPLERILERQESPEGTADEDGKDEGGAGAVAAPVLPELQEGGWLRDQTHGSSPRRKSQGSGQAEMERVDKEKDLWPKQRSLR